MQLYTARVELASKATVEYLSSLVDALADYHPVGARNDLGNAEIIISLPAENLRQACAIALSAVDTAGAEPVGVQILPADEFDRRASLPTIPDIVSVTEAAQILKISRQAVLQRIDRGTIPARRVGHDYAIARVSITT